MLGRPRLVVTLFSLVIISISTYSKSFQKRKLLNISTITDQPTVHDDFTKIEACCPIIWDTFSQCRECRKVKIHFIDFNAHMQQKLGVVIRLEVVDFKLTVYLSSSTNPRYDLFL